MTTYGYASGVSDDDVIEIQVETLRAAGCATIVREQPNIDDGADRPQRGALLALIDQRDTLVVTRLDRLARSVQELVVILDRLRAQGAAFRSLADEWADTTAPHGGLLTAVVGGLAAFERERAAARSGEARQKAQGARMGRPSSFTPDQRLEVLAALAAGHATQADLARRFNVNRSTISRLADKRAASSKPARPPIDIDTAHAARAFMRRLADTYPVVEGILYGSRARGTHTAASDADIAVVLDGPHGNRWEATRDMSGIAFDVMLETGIRIQPLPLWRDDLTRPGSFGNPALIATIRREGLPL